MRFAARLSLVLGLGALLLTAGPSTPADAGGEPALRTVTHDVATGVTRRDTSRRSGDRLQALRGRTGHLPAHVRDADELPSPRKVFGGDDREPVMDTELYPWSTVAKVVSTFPDGLVSEGSAVMVGPYQALTAAHVIYDDLHGGWASDVEVLPGYDLGFAPFGSYVAQEILSFTGFIDDGDYAYDFALLELDADAGEQTGWLGLAVRADNELLDGLSNTAGYPGDLENGEGMWYAADFAADVDATSIYMNGTLDAANGQSGSGVWLREGDERYVVGILSTETRSHNIAARITDDVFDTIDEWLGGDTTNDGSNDGSPPDGTDYWQPIQIPTKLTGRLMPDEEVRYQFRVDEPLQKIKFRLRRKRFRGFVLVVRPDGSTFKVLPRLPYRVVENQPQLGQWLLIVKNRVDAGRSRRFKVNINVK
jgi:V8-like Glu-specific endopeptidase